ncbi:MAG: FimV family protein, partial [Pseudomonadales bacterium]
MRTTLHVAQRLCGLLVLACLSAPTWALGLGELDLESALNERFKADIELFDTAGLEASEIRVSLASTEDFERVGVERFFFLTTLKFDIQDVRGKPVIRVSSTQPISEPYLNFLVEVLWPSGRMLKEYTVLLDPPTFTQAAAPAVSAPSRTTASNRTSGAIDRGNVAVPRSNSSGRGSRAGSANRGTVNGDGTYGATTRNDTLWK